MPLFSCTRDTNSRISLALVRLSIGGLRNTFTNVFYLNRNIASTENNPHVHWLFLACLELLDAVFPQSSKPYCLSKILFIGWIRISFYDFNQFSSDPV